MNTHIRTYKGILTVKELRQAIAGLDDSTQVTISSPMNQETPLDWYQSEAWNVEQVDVPDFDETFSLNLIIADTFDARQF